MGVSLVLGSDEKRQANDILRGWGGGSGGGGGEEWPLNAVTESSACNVLCTSVCSTVGTALALL